MSQVNVANDRDLGNSLQLTTADLLNLCGDPEFGVTGDGAVTLASVVESFCQDLVVLSLGGEEAPEEALQAIRRRARQMKAALPLLTQALSNR